jgi:PhzF family phenazine biosynthesis protein
VNIQLIKAFTKDAKLGNPAGVMLDAGLISDAQKQAIATDLGFSESAFVEDSENADFKVRFFSPTQEVTFCGHATIATFHSLVTAGLIKLKKSEPTTVTQETGIGILPVTCYLNGKIMMTQQKPEFSEIFKDTHAVASMLGLNLSDLTNLPIQIVSTGARQLVVVVNSLECLRKIKPNFKQIIEHSKNYDHAGICAITPYGFTDNGDIATRNFAPVFGIDEDPATGIAAGLVAWYANRYIFNQKKKNLIIEQGFDMHAASTILVDINDQTLVGGYAVQFDKV